MKHKVMKKILAAMLIIALGVTMLPAGKVNAATTKLSNPKIKKDSSMESGQVVTYDCVWFGSYPQAEVVPSKKGYTAIESEYLQKGDLIVDSVLYKKLKTLTGWDKNGDITYKGNKYRRMKKGDATVSLTINDPYYDWSDSKTYHYFKYEPIKWRVLAVDGKEALLLSDIGLDCKKYYEKRYSTTWEYSSLRKWLNGNFKNQAFSKAERKAIRTETVINADNSYPEWGTYGGNDTKDAVFLLSESEVYGTDTAVSYGFAKTEYDEARLFKCTTYAKAMGAWWDPADERKGYVYTWLRSPGREEEYAMCFDSYGYFHQSGFDAYWNYIQAVCPALKLNLSDSKLYSYAGTVSTNGSVKEVAPKNTDNSTKVTKLTNKNTTVKLSDTTYVYNGKARKPSIKVYDKNGKVIDKKYYSISYSDNIEVGKASITIKFKDKYSGTIKKTFTIKPIKVTAENIKVKLSKTVYTYNGKAKKPSVKVYDKAGNAIAKKYYTVSYTDNTEVGKATVTLKFKDRYTGTIKKIFTIKPIKVTDKNTTVKLSNTSYVYNGKAKRTNLKVYDKDGKVINKKYYSISYSDNIEVGKARITIKFKGKYSGTIKKNFTIKPIKVTIDNIKVKLSKTEYTYNGKEKKPSVKVYDKAGKVIDKKYYTVSYADNKNVGKATVILKFKDRYTGTIKKIFNINSKEPKAVDAVEKDEVGTNEGTAYQGKYIYYSVDSTIYKLNSETGTDTRVKSINCTRIEDIYYYDGYLYFTADYFEGTSESEYFICRMKPDGSGFEKLGRGYGSYVYNNMIYYIKVRNDDGEGDCYLGLASMKTNGNNKRMIDSSGHINAVAHGEGYIFYCKYESDQLVWYQYQIDKKKRKTISMQVSSGKYYVEGKYLISQQYDGSVYIYNIKTDSQKQITELNNVNILAVHDGLIYFSESNKCYSYSLAKSKKNLIGSISPNIIRLTMGKSKNGYQIAHYWFSEEEYAASNYTYTDAVCRIKLNGKGFKFLKKYYVS